MKKVLLIGPFPSPITGVSLANKVVKDVLDKSSYFKSSIINTSYTKFDENLGSFSLNKIFFYLTFNFQLYKVIKNDLIYITPGQTFYGVIKYANFILLSHFLNKKLIMHIHGNHLGNEYRSLRGFKKKLFYYLLSKTRIGIVLSESLRANMLPFIKPKNIYVLSNFAQDYLIQENKAVCRDELRIIFLSNLMVEKGIFDLLEALKKLEKENIIYKAKIAGNIEKSNIAKIKSHFKLLKNTTYIGVVYGNDKKELLEWGNIFILPTYYKMEGQPISIIEAMATKNVIITTKHAGIPDIIVDGTNGFFIEKKNANSIFSQLKYLDKHKDVIGDICLYNKNYFLDYFTLEKFKENIIKILVE